MLLPLLLLGCFVNVQALWGENTRDLLNLKLRCWKKFCGKCKLVVVLAIFAYLFIYVWDLLLKESFLPLQTIVAFPQTNLWMDRGRHGHSGSPTAITLQWALYRLGRVCATTPHPLMEVQTARDTTWRKWTAQVSYFMPFSPTAVRVCGECVRACVRVCVHSWLKVNCLYTCRDWQGLE